MSHFWPRAVVFDLDGTLVDSAPDIARALNAGIASVGLDPFPVEAVHGFIGGGAPLAIRRALEARAANLPPADVDKILERFYAAYIEVSAEGNGLFPGAVAMLDALTAAGHRLAICTNKSEPIAHVALKALGIDGHFQSIVGARDDLPKKPAADMVLKALAGLGLSPADGIMIGDSPADLGAARAAGIPAVLVSFGYSHTPARELGADRVIDHLSELPAAINDIRRHRG